MSDVKITPEARKIFQAFYDQRIREAGAAMDDQAELETARDLLRSIVTDGLTPTGDGGVSYIRRNAADWTDPATTLAAQAAAGGSRETGRRGQTDVIRTVLIFMGVLIFGGWYFFWSGGDGAETELDETAAVEPAEEATASDLTTPVPTLEAELLSDIVDSAGVKTRLVVPRTLEIKGVSFVVQPVKVTSGDWPLPFEERAVSWVYGTVVNYVMGLAASPANKQLIAELKNGDELLLRMSTGPAYRFTVVGLVRVSPQSSESFRQNQPGMTLVLLGDEAQETRVVVQATYRPESELGLKPEAEVHKAAVGETVTLNDTLKLTVVGSRLVTRAGGLPGYVYQTVDFAVESEHSLTTNGFEHHLAATGLTYPIVAVPHEENPYPGLPPTLPAGQVVTTSAVYALPETALAAGPAWEFSASPGGPKVRVPLPPYTGRFEPVVMLKTAQLADGQLMVTLGITAALHSLELNPADVELKGAALAPTGNYFPWRVAAGKGGEFLLLLTPEKETVVVGLLKQGFELTLDEGR